MYNKVVGLKKKKGYYWWVILYSLPTCCVKEVEQPSFGVISYCPSISYISLQ